MGIKVVSPGEVSIARVEDSMPALPRQEALRIRRASRAYIDVMLPTALRGLAEALECEDWNIRWKAIEKVMKMGLNEKSNEEADPDDTVVDGSVVAKDALSSLEDETKDGSGAPDADG